MILRIICGRTKPTLAGAESSERCKPSLRNLVRCCELVVAYGCDSRDAIAQALEQISSRHHDECEQQRVLHQVLALFVAEEGADSHGSIVG